MALNGKSLKGIPWDEFLYYDEISPTGLRHKTTKRYGNNNTLVRSYADSPAGSLSAAGYYIYTSSKYGAFPVHRIIYFMVTGNDIEDGFVIDHINGDRLDNRIDNLRVIEKGKNARNTAAYKNNTSGVVGVYFDIKSGYEYWKACWMELDGKQKTKAFSIKKYGYDGAFNLALNYRKEQISRLNSEGAGYTDRHGTKSN